MNTVLILLAMLHYFTEIFFKCQKCLTLTKSFEGTIQLVIFFNLIQNGVLIQVLVG